MNPIIYDHIICDGETLKISIETWKVGTVRKKFTVAREQGIIARVPYSSNATTNSENMKELFIKSRQKFNQGKIKNFQNTFGDYKHKFSTKKLDKKTGKITIERKTQIRHKYNFLEMGKNAGLLRTENVKINKTTKDFSVKLSARFKLTLDDKEYVGWGFSNLFYFKDYKSFKNKEKQTEMIQSALAQFFAQTNLPFNSDTTYDFKILKSNFNIYK